MTIEDNALEHLIACDALRLRESVPAASPLQAWHAARANAAWRMARRLRWIGASLSALSAVALLPVLLRAPTTLWWLLPLFVVLWPLLELAVAPRPAGSRR